MSKIEKSTFAFLKQLKQHNNRKWFQDNKTLYDQAQENMIHFADALLEVMRAHDDIETPSGKKSLFRIYRDIRFSKDKTPYKSHFSGAFKRATKYLRGGYYFHIEPGSSFAAGGFWGPNKEDLKHIRDHIAQDDSILREVLHEPSFKSTFGNLLGETLKTAPKGFERDHPSIDLLRHKSFIVKHDFSDEAVLSENFLIELNNIFQKMRGFFDCMTEILITDLNGELLPGY